jgi:predicted dithiol-disulfide oxidoreductase (DUF899 family)
MSITFPGESAEYRVARNRLLEKEIELRRAMEAVAAARRDLPPGGLVPEDYVFDGIAGPDGAPAKVKLSELFAPGKDSLVIYNFMFPRHPEDDRPGPTEGPAARLKREESPCPSCTAFIDEMNATVPHAEAAGLNFAIVAKAPLDRLIAWGEDRGWRNVRLLSAAHTPNFKRDYHAETPEGHQMPMMTVFRRDPSGIRHFWSSEMFYAPADEGQDPRHTGTIEMLWNLSDLTPEGRPADWHEQLDYECRHGGAPAPASKMIGAPAA